MFNYYKTLKIKVRNAQEKCCIINNRNELNSHYYLYLI